MNETYFPKGWSVRRCRKWIVAHGGGPRACMVEYGPAKDRRLMAEWWLAK